MASKSLLISLTLASHLGGCHKPHHFFKVVVEDATRSGKVGIPAKFARDYGNSLSNPVFIKHYSVEPGHFFVFRYEGGCHFHVIIFDRTATEIEYPDFEQEVKVEESDDDEELVNIANGISNGSRDKPGLQCPRLHKIRAFKSTNPFFSVFMPPSYVGPITNHSCSVGIPKDFSRLYLKDNSDVVLCDSDGKTWAAEYMSTFGTYTKTLFLDTFGELRHQHQCKPMSFEREIMAGNASPKKQHGKFKRPLCSTPQHHKADIDMASTSKSPMFKRVVLPVHLKEKRLGTPYAIFERYLTSGSEMVRLKVEDRWWPVKITSNR
ncbi:hypothetical protein F3Y22_tig00113124pilonHSYRG00232 [Hibiscus syriacus]|uniref:Uncharacterized protein n=1 Tax=Hibiscus syriacus TaxID=106335 RepID=A0A6A2X2T4_HIBSY|nr:hypothetical protein F3Y22_tig00113124pilonHSYRG00232 [Hibiscus syriacus]